MSKTDHATLDIAVANLLGGHSLTALEAAFARVSPKPNWKHPIDAVLPAMTEAEQTTLAYAVLFYTGSTAQFAALPDATVKVTAPGYYAAVGA